MSEVTERKLRIYTASQLKAQPEPEWVIDDLLEFDSLSMVSGAPNTGKTFVVLSMALHVATGTQWMGRPTKKSPVVYITGEAASGIRSRVEAWELSNGIALEREALFVMDAVQLRLSGGIDGLIAELESLGMQPKMIVFDTFARCFDGDENSAQDVGAAVRQLDYLRNRTGAAVVLVHHATKKGEFFRGSSALLGALDTAMEVKSGSGTKSIEIRCEKQKNAERFEKIFARMESVELPEVRAGVARSSLVVLPVGPEGSNGNEDKILYALSRLGGEAERKTWLQEVEAENPTISTRTFERVIAGLTASGAVRRLKRGTYQIVAATAGLDAAPPVDLGGLDPILTAATPTPLGGGVEKEAA